MAASRSETLIAQGLEARSFILLLLTITSLELAIQQHVFHKQVPGPVLADSLPVANRLLKHPLPCCKELLFQGLTLRVHCLY